MLDDLLKQFDDANYRNHLGQRRLQGGATKMKPTTIPARRSLPSSINTVRT